MNSPQPVIAIIAAIGSSIGNPETHGIYGWDNNLPWPRLETDVAFFKNKTTRNVVVMGRKTLISMFGPLPNRLNVVVSTTLPEGQNNWEGKDGRPFFVCSSVEKALAFARKVIPEADIFIIGGEQLWKESIPYCTNLFVTHVHGDFKEFAEGSKTFPQLLDPEDSFHEHDFRVVSVRTIRDGNYRLAFAEHQKGPPIYRPELFTASSVRTPA